MTKREQPPVYLTTQQLGQAMIQTVQQMPPAEKAWLRKLIRASFAKCSPRIN